MNGNVAKSRQWRSRPFAVLTDRVYAPRANNGRALRDAASNTAALLDGLPASARTCFLNIPDGHCYRVCLRCVCAMLEKYSTGPQ